MFLYSCMHPFMQASIHACIHLYSLPPMPRYDTAYLGHLAKDFASCHSPAEKEAYLEHRCFNVSVRPTPRFENGPLFGKRGLSKRQRGLSRAKVPQYFSKAKANAEIIPMDVSHHHTHYITSSYILYHISVTPKQMRRSYQWM